MYKGDKMKISKYIDCLIRMVGYALVLIAISIVFNDTVFDPHQYWINLNVCDGYVDWWGNSVSYNSILAKLPLACVHVALISSCTVPINLNRDAI